jgi:hypothetical protein
VSRKDEEAKGFHCIQWKLTVNSWHDNYLCGKDNLPSWPEDFKWSSEGKPAGYNCLPITDQNPPSSDWQNTFFCWKSETFDPGFKWASNDESSMECVRMKEGTFENYLCLPKSSPFQLVWAASVSRKDEEEAKGFHCIQWKLTVHSWHDNYLCGKAAISIPISKLKHDGGCNNYDKIQGTKYESKHTQAGCALKCEKETGCYEFNLNKINGYCALMTKGCVNDNHADWETYEMISKADDKCSTSPCKNGAMCTTEGNTYKCHCLEGFAGTDCSQGKISTTGMTADQSSTTFGAGANRAIDGNSNGVFSQNSCTHTDMGHNEWWRLDMKKMYRITEIILHNREENPTRMNNVKVFVSKDVDGKEQTQCGSTISGISSSSSLKILLSCNITGRFIRAEQTNEVLTICELELFGEEVTAQTQQQTTQKPKYTKLNKGEACPTAQVITNKDDCKL